MDVLEARAARLAAVPPSAPDGPAVELLRFAIGSERYAIPTKSLHAVIRIESAGAVPNSPRHLLGVINYLGEALPLFDLRPLWFAQPPADESVRKAIVLGRDAPELAIAIAEVDTIATTPLAGVQAHAHQPDDLVWFVEPDGCFVLDDTAILNGSRFFCENDS